MEPVGAGRRATNHRGENQDHHGQVLTRLPRLLHDALLRRYGEQLRALEDGLGRQATYEEAQAVLEPGPVSWYNFRHTRSSRDAILREEEAGSGYHVRLHGDGSITWEGTSPAQTAPSRRVEEPREPG